MSVSGESCCLLGRGPCDGLRPRPEESERLWCVNCVFKCNNTLYTYDDKGRTWSEIIERTGRTIMANLPRSFSLKNLDSDVYME